MKRPPAFDFAEIAKRCKPLTLRPERALVVLVCKTVVKATELEAFLVAGGTFDGSAFTYVVEGTVTFPPGTLWKGSKIIGPQPKETA